MMDLAQIAPELNLTQALISQGPVGVFLWWLMVRIEKRLESFQASQDRMARATAALVTGSDTHTDGAKAGCREITDEIEALQKTK